MADRNTQPGRGEAAPQSTSDTAPPGKEKVQHFHEKGSGPISSLRLNLPVIQSPLGDHGKMQGNGTIAPSYRSLGDLKEGLKLDMPPVRSPPRPLESPFKRPPALLGPFPSGMQSPEVIDPNFFFFT